MVRGGLRQGPTRVPQGFHQVLRGLRGGSRVPPASARWVLPGFHQVLRGLRGGPEWFEVRFHEGSTRVPPGSARAAGWSGVVCKVPRENSTRF